MSVYNYNGQVISDISNVKDYGAIGNGIADDTTSIQNALSTLSESGGVVFFPKGTYKITANILFYSNQTLLFENGATILQGGNIDNLFMSYCANETTEYNGVHDCLIFGATFDGGAYITNNTLVGIIHCKNITFENCVFKNAYGSWHDLEVNSSYNVKIINCDFEGSRKTTQNGCMIQIDAINNTNTWPWTNRGAVDDTISKYVEIADCIFHDDTISPAIGNHSTATDNFVRIHGNVFEGLTSARGAINFQSCANVDVCDNTFNGCTIGVGSGGTTYNISDNRFVDGTTLSSGTGSNVHDNMVNGTYVA